MVLNVPIPIEFKLLIITSLKVETPDTLRFSDWIVSVIVNVPELKS